MQLHVYLHKQTLQLITKTRDYLYRITSQYIIENMFIYTENITVYNKRCDNLYKIK